jgi:hypothetical protein
VPIGKRDGLAGVAGLSSTDVWAVGSYYSSGNLLTMHWDGSRWRVVEAPPDPDFEIGQSTYLKGIDMLSANDVWAVGSLGSSRPFEAPVPVAMHWDGAQWSHIPISITQEFPPALNSVSAVAPNDIWAVGDSGRGRYGNVPTLLHWNGTVWELVRYPGTGTSRGYINAVAALATDDVWAVGTHILHWDGKAWDLVLKNVGLLSGLAAIGPNDIWAVGSDFYRPVTMHWDGKSWTNVSDQLPVVLDYVAAVASDDVWALGSGRVYHWDGKSWGEVPSPINPGTIQLNAIAAVGGDIWIVGYEILGLHDARPLRSYILRHTSSPCQGTPTPAPSPSPTSPRRPTKPPLDPPVPVPGPGGHTFTETGHTVPGVFLDHWIQHNGLSRYGLPISEAIGEVSEVDGKTYTMQYFERAVFEYHPENSPPHNVLLSLIGVSDYRRVYGPNGAPNQRVGRNPHYFPETGHSLGGIFHTQWITQGGLTEYGYPISDEFEELSLLDGNVYTMQYFERAVFEWHRENELPHTIQLSHLGRWRYDSLYAATP